MAALVIFGLAAGCDSGSPPDAEPPPVPTVPVGAPDVQLVAFESCDETLDRLRGAAAAEVGPYGLGQPELRTMEQGDVAAEAAPSRQKADASAQPHSKTNTHEAAADEPDLVKTDGRNLVSVVDDRLRVVDARSRTETATVDLDGVEPEGLFLDGDRALVLSGNSQMRHTGEEDRGYVPQVRMIQVDIASGRITGELTVDGEYVDARSTGGVARIVTRSGPQIAWERPAKGVTPADAEQANREIVRDSTIDDWLPQYTLSVDGTETSGRLVDCSRVSHPKPDSGTSMLTVLTLDVDGELDRGDPVSITGTGGTVYGNGENLYVADDGTGRFMPMATTTDIAPTEPQSQRTRVYQFDVRGKDAPQFVASGAVDGSLLNQYAMSEHDGHLRVATTTMVFGDGTEGGTSESAVTVLRQDGERLVKVGRVGGLGKDERIYSVRYLGDVAYVVTFRQTDPLYRVDLSDPAKPKVVGELKITGYSSYLHPVGEGRLLGVGQEATEQGRTTGSQVSLFDVSGADPRRLGQLHLPHSTSEAEYNPHAFLYWADRDLVVVPVRGDLRAQPERESHGSPSGARALVLRIDGDRVERVGMIAHSDEDNRDGFGIRRSLVIGETLWTVSRAGAQANNLDDLDRTSFVEFG